MYRCLHSPSACVVSPLRLHLQSYGFSWVPRQVYTIVCIVWTRNVCLFCLWIKQPRFPCGDIAFQSFKFSCLLMMARWIDHSKSVRVIMADSFQSSPGSSRSLHPREVEGRYRAFPFRSARQGFVIIPQLMNSGPLILDRPASAFGEPKSTHVRPKSTSWRLAQG